jgi:ribosomal protein S12 methylthiotransferase accessory factor
MRSDPPTFSEPSVLDPRTGLVNYLAEVQNYRSDPDVFVVAAELADTARLGLPAAASDTGSGAGLSFEAALGAAVGEAVERYACCITPHERLTYGSAAVLASKGYEVVGSRSWCLFDPAQDITPFLSPFAEESPIAWTEAESLNRARSCLAPACIVYMPYEPVFPEQGEQIVAFATSTGVACAKSRTEAVLKGLCEVAERDAIMIVWRNRLSCPQLEIDDGSDFYSLIQKRFLRPYLDYRLFYTTLDLGIPSFFGVLRDLRRDPPPHLVGGAAHPDPRQAVLKTFLELTQSLKWLDHMGVRSVPLEEGFRNIRSFSDRVRLYAFQDMTAAFQFLWESKERILLSEIPSLDAGTMGATLRRCLMTVENRGLEILASDLTPVDVAECGLVVVRTMIPGCVPMEGDHLLPCLGGSRWRELPVQLGMLTAPLHIDQINPFPHPYP